MHEQESLAEKIIHRNETLKYIKQKKFINIIV